MEGFRFSSNGIDVKKFFWKVSLCFEEFDAKVNEQENPLKTRNNVSELPREKLYGFLFEFLFVSRQPPSILGPVHRCCNEDNEEKVPFFSFERSDQIYIWSKNSIQKGRH